MVQTSKETGMDAAKKLGRTYSNRIMESTASNFLSFLLLLLSLSLSLYCRQLYDNNIIRNSTEKLFSEAQACAGMYVRTYVRVHSFGILQSSQLTSLYTPREYLPLAKYTWNSLTTATKTCLCHHGTQLACITY